MREIFVECKPDEILVKKLGFTQRNIRRCNGKGNIFNEINRKNRNNIIAIFDEDPGSPKHRDFSKLKFIEEKGDFKLYTDTRGNIFIELQVKLEHWILLSCKKSNIDINKTYNLSNDVDKFHRDINNNLMLFERLINDLFNLKNQNLYTLLDVVSPYIHNDN